MTADNGPAAEPLLPALVTALSGLPIGLLTATLEYGLAAVACVASTAAELLAVYRSHVHAGPIERSSDNVADVIELRRDGASGPRQ
jgi:hypothetical protein